MKYFCQLIILSVLTLTLNSCIQTAPRSEQETEQEETARESLTPQIKVLFDESEGLASNASNFYFLFDMSGSMDERCSGKRKIDGARDAVTRFMRNIPDDVNIGLMLFGTRNGDGFAEALPISSGNKQEFLDILNSLQPEGKTPLGEALLAGVEKIVGQYKKQLGYGTYRIIIITDGEQTGIDLKQPCDNLAQHGFIGLYSIGLCMDKSHTLKKYSLSYRDANNYEELEEALVEATAESEVFDAGLFDENLYKTDTIRR
jgi:Ca-activated chloride channel homolog